MQKIVEKYHDMIVCFTEENYADYIKKRACTTHLAILPYAVLSVCLA